MNSGAELIWQAAAAANLLEARKKKGRVGSKKSRTGCVNCKLRRVKCDERHPECERCISTGRKCEGYIVAPVQKTGSTLIGGRLSQALGLGDTERRTFDYFLSWTAPRLAGSLDRNFWCDQVLRVAQAEPVVLNALLAISTLYEHPQFLKSFYADPDKASYLCKVLVPEANEGVSVIEANSPTDGPILRRKGGITGKEPGEPPHPAVIRPPIDQYHTNALRHYNRAIQAFKARMEAGTANTLLALISCTLFICIELLRDDVFSALTLFAKGLGLLKQISASSEKVDQVLLKTLRLIYARLGVMVAIFGYPLDVPQEIVNTDNARSFENTEDARAALCALLFESHAYIRDVAAIKARLGHEEPQDPLAFDPAMSKIDPVSQSSQAALPPNLEFRPTGPISRLYMGYLPEQMHDATCSEPDRISSSPNVLNSYPPSPTGTSNFTKPVSNASGSESPFSCKASHGSTADQLHFSPGSESRNLASSNQFNTIDCYSDPPNSLPPLDLELLGNSGRLPWWVPSDLLERQMQLERRLNQWHEAFQFTQGTDEEAKSSLLMYFYVFSIWLKTRTSSYQTVFDQYTFHFQQILDLAEKFVGSKSAEQPTFTFETGVVPQLFFLVNKCRVPSLRRKGLELMMKAPKKECVFGSKSCAEFAARLVAIEEEGLGLSPTDVDDTILPAEEQRIQSYEILQDNTAARYEVRVTRYRRDSSGRQEKTVTDYPI